MSRNELVALSLLGLLALAGGVYLGIWLARWWRSFRLTQRLARSRQGERDAETYLRELGYRIVARQMGGRVEVSVDGRPFSAEVLADIIAEKDGIRYLVEVKTGEKAPDPLFPPTRRQLLEYSLAFKGHRVLLLDMEAGLERRIEFPALALSSARPSRARLPWLWLAGGMACGLLIAWLVSRA